MINNFNNNKKYNYSILLLEHEGLGMTVNGKEVYDYAVKDFINCRTNRWDYFLRRLKEIKKQYPKYDIAVYDFSDWNAAFNSLIAFENYDNFDDFDYPYFYEIILPLILERR